LTLSRAGEGRRDRVSQDCHEDSGAGYSRVLRTCIDASRSHVGPAADRVGPRGGVQYMIAREQVAGLELGGRGRQCGMAPARSRRHPTPNGKGSPAYLLLPTRNEAALVKCLVDITPENLQGLSAHTRFGGNRVRGETRKDYGQKVGGKDKIAIISFCGASTAEPSRPNDRRLPA